MKKTVKSALSLITAIVIFVSSLLMFSSCKIPIRVNQNGEYGLFGTFISLIDHSGDGVKAFDRRFETVIEMATEYDRLFDIYNEYEGINNLATVNRLAADGPVKVDGRIIDLIMFSIEIYNLTGGSTDITMGPVLKIWHDHREAGNKNPAAATLPDMAELASAAELVGMDGLIINEEESTVYFAKPGMSLDVGAVAKGYTTERLAEWLAADGADGYVIDFGGNLRAIGYKADGNSWSSGVRNPNLDDYENPYIYYFKLADGSAVTSGNYENYYTVGGKSYNHIINKDTLMPAEYFTSVTVITKNSGLADGLSTALFNMSYDDGRALVDSLEGVRVIWLTADGELILSE